MIRSGDSVLFKYPHTDYSVGKRRPVLVITERPDFENEFLITFLTSQIWDFNKGWDIALDPESMRDHQPTESTLRAINSGNSLPFHSLRIVLIISIIVQFYSVKYDST